MNDELKPVLCGCSGEAQVVRYSVKDWDLNKWVPAFYVKCKKCGIRTIDYPTEAEAIEAWNTAMGAYREFEWCNECKDTGIREEE